MNYNIPILDAYKISKTKKDFICFDIQNNKIVRYILTNDLTRHRLTYQQFRLVCEIRKEILTVKL